MNHKIRYLVYAALLASLYVTLTYLQNFILPGSATWAIQCRLSESLCIFALFTPAAVPGLSIGCLLFNLSYAGALPLDFLVGTLATALSTGTIWLTRRLTVKGYPLPAMLMPSLFNAVLVGWELTAYVGGGFPINAVYVAMGEAIVMFLPGSALYYAIKVRKLDQRLFP